ncbi:aminoglycoside phosphotransferase family protein [Streptomyces sp. NBC_00441]|uniref:aminoglycoside phosphotransferase family protein n=1 Tax=Streptomyces sp. NBC_00441 TaxID=2975742 RepID=UPI002E2B53F2|nr:aminoglycoside phosphotransferase family protein [Streptomyces sp. NBC_00441]
MVRTARRTQWAEDREPPLAATSDRPAIDTPLVRRLVDSQFPQWAGLPLERLTQAGADHVIHRLGRELSVRLPRYAGAIGQARKELTWLPRLAPHLPLAVPEPVAVGEPGLGYPWPWAVTRWLDGEPATVEVLGDSHGTAVALAGFLTALRRFEPAPLTPDIDRTADSPHGRDRATRAAIATLDGVFDAGAMTKVWEAALDAPVWDRAPVWVHGDFHTGNLLTRDGRLGAVIDFGGLGLGDPACDMMIAYTLLSADSRAAFRAALGPDDATWARGRGWALATGLNAYTFHAATDPRVAAQTTRQIKAALAG